MDMILYQWSTNGRRISWVPSLGLTCLGADGLSMPYSADKFITSLAALAAASYIQTKTVLLPAASDGRWSDHGLCSSRFDLVLLVMGIGTCSCVSHDCNLGR